MTAPSCIPRFMRETYLGMVGALLCGLSGCTMVWTRPNTGPEQVHQDYADCEIGAYGKHPENMVHVQSDNPHEPTKIFDANTTIRDEETKYCMRQRGYVLERPR